MMLQDIEIEMLESTWDWDRQMWHTRKCATTVKVRSKVLGGFALHRMVANVTPPDHPWYITHIKSSLSIRGYKDATIALAALRALAEITIDGVRMGDMDGQQLFANQVAFAEAYEQAIRDRPIDKDGLKVIRQKYEPVMVDGQGWHL